MAEQDLFAISIITIINTAFLIVLVKWILPSFIDSFKEVMARE